MSDRLYIAKVELEDGYAIYVDNRYVGTDDQVLFIEDILAPNTGKKVYTDSFRFVEAPEELPKWLGEVPLEDA